MKLLRVATVGLLVGAVTVLTDSVGTVRADGWYYPSGSYSPYEGYADFDDYGLYGWPIGFPYTTYAKYWSSQLGSMCEEYHDPYAYGLDYTDMNYHMDATSYYATSFPIDYLDLDDDNNDGHDEEAEIGIKPCDMIGNYGYYWYHEFVNIDDSGGHFELNSHKSVKSCWWCEWNTYRYEGLDTDVSYGGYQGLLASPVQGTLTSDDSADIGLLRTLDTAAVRRVIPEGTRLTAQLGWPMRVSEGEAPSGREVFLTAQELQSADSLDALTQYIRANRRLVARLNGDVAARRLGFVATFRSPIDTEHANSILRSLQGRYQYQLMARDKSGMDITLGGEGLVDTARIHGLLTDAEIDGELIGLVNIWGVADRASGDLQSLDAMPDILVVDVMSSGNLAYVVNDREFPEEIDAAGVVPTLGTYRVARAILERSGPPHR